MNLFSHGLGADWASVLGLLIWPVTINGLDMLSLGQSELEKWQPLPFVVWSKLNEILPPIRTGFIKNPTPLPTIQNKALRFCFDSKIRLELGSKDVINRYETSNNELQPVFLLGHWLTVFILLEY